MVKSISFSFILYSISVIAGTTQASNVPQHFEGGITDHCCDTSIHVVQKTTDSKNYSKRLDSFRDWLCSYNKPCKQLQDAVLQRYNLFLDTTRWNLTTDGYETYGPSDAKIKIAVFISLSCPLCKRLYNELIDSLSAAPLGKSVSVTALLFTNGEPDRLYAALFKSGKQTALLRALYPLKERVSSEVILKVADSLGIDTVDLLKKARSSEIINFTNRSREVGIAAGVKVTPTFFINNIRYSSYKDIRWIMDYLEVIAQRLSNWQ
jgi:protein-disulfide isomerase